MLTVLLAVRRTLAFDLAIVSRDLFSAFELSTGISSPRFFL